MSVEIDTVITRFETEAGQAISETERLSLSLDKARRATESLPSSAAKADKAVMSLGERMKAFAREERSEGRTASFFVSQLEAIAPRGSMAATVLGELTQVMVGGMGLGLAFGAVGIATRLVTDAWEKQEKAAQALQAATKKLADEQRAAYDASKKNADEAAESMRRALFMAKGGLELDYRVIEAMKAKTAAEKEYRDALKEDKAYRDAMAGGPGYLDALRAGKPPRSPDQIGALENAAKAARDREIAALAEKEAFIRQFEKEAATKTAEEKDRLAAEAFAVMKRLHDQELEALRFSIDEQYAAEEAGEKAIFEMKKAAGEQAWQLQVQEAERLTALERKSIEERKRMEQEFNDFLASSGQSVVSAYVAQFKPLLTQSAAYSRAMRAQGKATEDSVDLSAAAFAALTQNMLADISQQATVKALMEVAEGIAAYARYDAASGSQHMAAAGAFGAVAGAAAVGAVVIGKGRGMTRAERESLKDFEDPSKAGSVTSGMSPGTSGGDKTITKTETIFVIGDPFESPAETARRAARALELAKRLDMNRRDA